MRNVKWSSVEAVAEGEFKKLEPGAYVASIVKVVDVPEKEYVQVLYDIAEGPHKGFFSDAFYADKAWAHSIVMSYKDTALGMLKGRMETIQKCNQGFDPFAAWDAGRLDMFAGRRVGIVLRQEEYWDKKTEEFKLGSAKCYRLCTIDDVASGKLSNPEPKMLDDAGKREALKRAGYFDSNIDEIMRNQGVKSQAAAPANVQSRDAYDDDIPFA